MKIHDQDIQIKKTGNETEQEAVFQIRHDVFVIEQKVPQEEEYDEYETLCDHFLVLLAGRPAACARIRPTDKGVKLERMAVRKEFRQMGIGLKLLQHLLVQEQVQQAPKVYLHAQEHAVNFYEKAQFSPEGDRFFEAGIPHFKMVWKGNSHGSAGL